ncbi:MAG: tetratricopeptide repeat protein [Synechococcales bacterium]|nr:tetratricopeptide repeat protein [Synechococcales bacterium]
MIVKNEAANLPRCLESVASVVDELLVVDTGSTDGTVAIAQQFNARVHTIEWPNDFAVARNESLKHATGDWVLVLDADERLAADMGSQIRQAIQGDRALVVNLVRQEIGAVQSPYSLVSRLFRRHPDIRFHRPYHALIDDSVAAILQREPQWTVQQLPEVAILHEGYQPGAIAQQNKLQRARLAMERFLVRHPGDPYVCSKLGALYVQLGRFETGIDLLERGLKSQDVDPPVRYELHYHLGIAYSRLKHPAQAAQHYEQALRQPLLDKLKLGAYNNLGSLRQAAQDFSGAKALYEQAIEIDPGFAIAHYNLGMTFKAMGQLAEALASYLAALELNPSYAEAYQNLGVVLFKLGKMPEGVAAFKQAIALHYEQLNPQEAQRLRQGLYDMGFRV